MVIDLAVLGDVALSAALVFISFAIPVMVIVGLLWLARRRYAGRRSRLDGLFEGIGRANAINSHLNAGTPDPDDLAVPHPEPLPCR